MANKLFVRVFFSVLDQLLHLLRHLEDVTHSDNYKICKQDFFGPIFS